MMGGGGRREGNKSRMQIGFVLQALEQEAGSRRAVGKLLQEYHASRFSELNVKAQVTQA